MILLDNCMRSVFFRFLYTKTLKHVNRALYEKENYIIKNVSSVFQIVRYQNAKMLVKHFIYGNETNIPETIFFFFFSVLNPKR